MKHRILLTFLLFLLTMNRASSWGFFGHQLINRMAVFTLPEPLIGFYKQNLEYIGKHAVDADKRRYSDTAEACRHYIDLDYYETSYPIDTLPHHWKDAVLKYTEDTLLANGIVPWHVQRMLYRLTEAFKSVDVQRILHVSADLGHYMADACVPLHATMNYNGQLTGQHGIHALWESRLVELFSNRFNFFTGRAQYLDFPDRAVWDACSGSFLAKDSVLAFESKLQLSFAPDQKFSYERKGRMLNRVYSKSYSEAYFRMLDGQVERRMRLAIHLTGCMWYTAWVNAGQPDLPKPSETGKPQTGFGKAEHAEESTHTKPMIGRQE